MQVSFALKKQLDQFQVDVSCQFDSGVLVIQGESGSGKTTILDCIAGLRQPDSGLVQIGTRMLYNSQQQINVPVRQRKIGYVFQNYALFPNLTVEKNILYGIKNYQSAKEKNHQQKLLDYANYLMDAFRLNHLRKKHPRQISGGEKQRTALARALVTKPDLLLLDEPFSALDVKTKEIVYQEFLELKQTLQTPMILISHDPHEGELFADQRIFLQQGQIYG